MRAGLTPWNTIESGAARTLTIRRPTADRVSRRRAASTSGSSGIALVYPRPRRGAGDARPPHVIRFGPIWGRVPENPREELSMARMTGGEAIVKALAREGVKVAFGLPGVELDDQLDAIAGSTKWRHSIMQVADAPRIVREAFAQLRSGRPRPVAIDMPWDTMEEEVDVTLPAVGPHPAPAAAPAADVDRAAEALLRAQRVAIYAGGGVNLSGAHAALAAVAEHLQAGVVETAEGRGALSGASDLSFGAVLFPTGPLRRNLAAADG